MECKRHQKKREDSRVVSGFVEEEMAWQSRDWVFICAYVVGDSGFWVCWGAFFSAIIGPAGYSPSAGERRVEIYL